MVQNNFQFLQSRRKFGKPFGGEEGASYCQFFTVVSCSGFFTKSILNCYWMIGFQGEKKNTGKARRYGYTVRYLHKCITVDINAGPDVL